MALPPVTEVNGTRVSFVDKVDQLAAVVSHLRYDEAIGVDLEGEALGRYGTILTLQLHSSGRDPVVYVVDVMLLGSSAFEDAGLRRLLESESPKKLFFDVRADANALFYHFNVRMVPQGVVDLQLLATCAMVRQGNSAEYLTGLAALMRNPRYLTHLSRDQRARIQEVKGIAAKLFQPEHGGSYAVWRSRPLDPVLLEYVTDVQYFHHLHRQLQKSATGLSEPLLQATARRIDFAHSEGYSRNLDRDFFRLADTQLLTDVRAALGIAAPWQEHSYQSRRRY